MELKNSYTVQDLKNILTEAGVSDTSVFIFISQISTTMVGRSLAIPFITDSLSAYYQDELGTEVTPDQFVLAVSPNTPTFSSLVMISNMKEYWSYVNSSLKNCPKSFLLWKEIIILTQQEFKDKPNMGIKQLRQFVYTIYINKVIELFK